MQAKQSSLFLIAYLCSMVSCWLMILPANVRGGESQVKILSDDTSYCSAPTFPFPLELYPNYNKSEQFDVKYEAKEVDGANRSVKQFRIRATLYFIDSSQRIFFNLPYYRFYFGGVKNLDSTYGFCLYKDMIARREHWAEFVIGKKYWLLLERRPNPALYYDKALKAWIVPLSSLEDKTCMVSALQESTYYEYYIIDAGECK